MQLRIRTISGKTYSIEVLKTDTISNVKAAINDKDAIPPSKQILKFEGQLLGDGKSLEDYKIKSNSILELSFRKDMSINVQTATRIITLSVKEMDTVQRVKAKLDKERLYTIDQEILVFKGQHLKCMHKLSEYGIKNRSTIHTQPGMCVNLVTLEKKSIHVCCCELNDTIESVKLKIQGTEGYLVDKQRIICAGQDLEDNSTISQCVAVGKKNDWTLVLRNEGGMQIFARRQSGKIIQLEVEATDIVATIKTKITDKVDIVPSKQILIWNGSQLKDNQSLHECKVSRKCTLDLIVADEALSGNAAHMFFTIIGDLKKELCEQNKIINQRNDDMKQNLQQLAEHIQTLTVAFAGKSKLKCMEQQCQLTSIMESAPLLQASNESVDTCSARTVDKTIKQTWAIPRAEVNCNGTRLDRGKWGHVVKTKYSDQDVAATCLSEDVISINNQKHFVDRMNQSVHFRHCNLVEFIGAVPGIPAIIVMQYMDATLQETLDAHLTPNHNYPILMDVAKGLLYLHSIQPQAVAHGSVNPSRVFLKLNNRAWQAKLSHPASEHFTRDDSIEVTIPAAGLSYTAPEIKQRNMQTIKSDIYSYGVLIIHLLTRKSAYDSIAFLWQYLHLQFPNIVPILQACTNANPSNRSPIEGVIEQLKAINI